MAMSASVTVSIPTSASLADLLGQLGISDVVDAEADLPRQHDEVVVRVACARVRFEDVGRGAVPPNHIMEPPAVQARPCSKCVCARARLDHTLMYVRLPRLRFEK